MRKILVSAFSILPNRGSEPGVGWNWAVQMSNDFEVVVLTRTKSKEIIQSELSKLGNSNLRFIYVDSSKFLRKISIYFEYINWQRKAFLYLKKHTQLESYDYLWHLTFGNVFLPTYIYKIDIPFIWGPLGGGERVYRNQYRYFKLKERFVHILKSFLVKTVQLNPYFMRPTKKAISIIAKTQDTKKLFPNKYQHKVVLKLETAFKFHSTDSLNRINTSNLNKHRFCYTGRLISFKNLKLAFDALDLLKNNYDFSFHIVGDGPKIIEYKKYCKKIGLIDRVIFYGPLPREETLNIVRMCDIYLFPSLREGGTWSLMEAMALGKPSVCINTSGMKMIVNKECAMTIELGSNNIMVRDFKKKIQYLLDNPKESIRIGKLASEHIESNFSPNSVKQFINSHINSLEIEKENSICNKC